MRLNHIDMTYPYSDIFYGKNEKNYFPTKCETLQILGFRRSTICWKNNLWANCRTQTKTQTWISLVRAVNRLAFHLKHNKLYVSDVLPLDEILTRKQYVWTRQMQVMYSLLEFMSKCSGTKKSILKDNSLKELNFEWLLLFCPAKISGSKSLF